MQNHLPPHWSWRKLGSLVADPKRDLVDGPFGSNLKSHEYVEAGIPVFKIQNIKANRFVDKNLNYVTEEKAEQLSRHSFRDGDLIITKLGDPLGLCCKVPKKFKHGIIVADLIRMRPDRKDVFDDYLINAINSDVVQHQFKTITKGTTRPRVNLTIVRKIEIPLPPLPEQHRIVAKIESLFSDLDKGIESLKTAQQQLKVYRQAVLKWAFEGKLTEEWRKKDCKRKSKQVSTRVRLEKSIAAEPEVNYVASTVIKLSLPHGWKQMKVGEIGKLVSGQHILEKDYNFENEGIPYFTGPADFGNEYPIVTKWTKYPKAIAKNNDVLITVKGAGVGKINMMKTETAAISRQLMAISSDMVEAKFLYLFLSSKFFDFQKLGLGSTVPGLDRETILNFCVPVCSQEEQYQIVSEIEVRLSVCDKLEVTIKENLQKAEALRQSILKKAFEGMLA